MSDSKKISDKWLLFPILLLALNFLYRLIDESKLLRYFPLDFFNDLSSYMAQIHFIKVCGFHQFCPYWYNGFTTFTFSPPAWYYFAYPFYLLFHQVNIALYLTLLISFLAGFILLYFLTKPLGLTPLKRIFFFLLFFTNASAIGNFIRLGRAHELFSWVFFILLFFTLYTYRKKPLDWIFYLSAPTYALIILSYHSTAVLAGLLWLGFLLVKRKDFLKIIATLFSSFLLSSFWLVPFVLKIFTESAIPHLKQGQWIWSFTPHDLYTQIALAIIPLATLLLFFFYTRKEKVEFLFFAPSMILCLLFFLRLSALLPIFDQIYPDPILHYFIFLATFFLLMLDLTSLPPLLKKALPYLLTLFALLSVLINIVHTPLFAVPTPLENEFSSYLPNLHDRFIMVGTYPEGPFPKAFYSLAATQNVKSISGWYPEEKEYSYLARMDGVYRAFDRNDCLTFRSELSYFNTTEVLARKEFCEQLNQCGLHQKIVKENSCLYSL